MPDEDEAETTIVLIGAREHEQRRRAPAGAVVPARRITLHTWAPPCLMARASHPSNRSLRN